MIQGTLSPLDRAQLALERGTTALRQGEFLEAANCFWMAADYLRQAGEGQSALADTLAHHARLAMESFGATRQ